MTDRRTLDCNPYADPAGWNPCHMPSRSGLAGIQSRFSPPYIVSYIYTRVLGEFDVQVVVPEAHDFLAGLDE